jgi:uncharacterized protein YcbX
MPSCASGPPRVTRLSVTPVKGFGLDHPHEVGLDASGAVGDRDFFLAACDGDKLVSVTKTGAWLGLRAAWDRAGGRLTIRDEDGRRWEAAVEPGEPVVSDHFGLREIAGRVVEGPWTEMLSERSGRTVRLVLADAPGAASDVHPVTLLGDASVDDLARRAGLAEVDPRRFRMLLGIGACPAHAEDGWEGARVAVGGAVLEIGGPVPRCAATTRHPDEGHRDEPIVRHLRRYRGVQPNELGRGVNFGVYARVLEPGPVRVGDELRFC